MTVMSRQTGSQARELLQVGTQGPSLVDPNFFGGRERSKFWVGPVAIIGEVVNSAAHGPTTHFVNSKYVDLGFRTPEAAGREDPDFGRITRYAVVENRLGEGGEPQPAVVGSVSAIIKKSISDSPLPIEQKFPDVPPIGGQSGEVHDYVVRYPGNKNIQHIVTLMLIAALASGSKRDDVRHGYAQVEAGLKRFYTSKNVQIEVLAPPRVFPEPKGQTRLFPIKLNYQSIGRDYGDGSMQGLFCKGLLMKFIGDIGPADERGVFYTNLFNRRK